MFRLFTASLIVVGCVSFAPAQEKEKAGDKPAAKTADANPLKQAVIDNPDDINAIRKFILDKGATLRALSESDADAAEKQLKDVQTFLTTLKPKEAAGKRMLASGRTYLQSLEQQIALGRLSLKDITDALEDDPNDLKALGNYGGKLASLISPITRKDPEKAGKLLAQGQEFLNGLSEKTEEKATETAIKRALASISRYKRTIESAKKLLALIGSDAAKLGAEAWVNGKPLSDDDLKGKVVLLDFWAVWCGPCIATFPHLREWDKKYDDLEIIGVTSYYKRKWDEKAKRAISAKDVSEEVEQDMLVQFAKHHKLTHRFALQTDRELSAYYGVTGIPQAVVIDRTGKVRLIKVGSGEANAKEIQEMIEKLIDE